MDYYTVNDGKEEVIDVNGVKYRRLCIRTHVITDKDDIVDVATKYAKPYLHKNDVLFITEKIVGCTQGRAIPLSEIHPRKLAVILSRFVLRTPYGIGLAMPETMEMALKECGTVKILFAAGVSALGKLIGKRGWFYKIAGEKARSIDGPCECTIPPYNECVSLAPLNPDDVAKRISEAVGSDVIITDINDLGGNILGTSSPSINRDLYVKILKDNPLGQSSEQTPMGIIRKTD